MPANPAIERSFYPPPEAPGASDDVLERLTLVHEECVETARHAALLTQTPAAARALILGCALVVGVSATSVSPVTLGLWVALVLAAAFALLRMARQTERSAFELLPLRAFSLDLNAMLLYAGFAWGAGAFLALAPTAGMLTMGAYSVGAGLVMSAVLRVTTPILCFLIPSLALGAAAALAGSAGVPAAAAIIVSGLILAGTSAWAERRRARRHGVPLLPSSPIPKHSFV